MGYTNTPLERYGNTSIMGMYLLIHSTSIFKAYAEHTRNVGNTGKGNKQPGLQRYWLTHMDVGCKQPIYPDQDLLAAYQPWIHNEEDTESLPSNRSPFRSMLCIYSHTLSKSPKPKYKHYEPTHNEIRVQLVMNKQGSVKLYS